MKIKNVLKMTVATTALLVLAGCTKSANETTPTTGVTTRNDSSGQTAGAASGAGTSSTSTIDTHGVTEKEATSGMAADSDSGTTGSTAGHDSKKSVSGNQDATGLTTAKTDSEGAPKIKKNKKNK